MKSLLLITFLSFAYYSTTELTLKTEVEFANSIKEQAFKVLEAKCNVCHKKKNKRMVFTLDNMDRRAKKINRQVFKWKRMPKGDEIKLTKKEAELLKKWISKNLK